MIEVGEYIRTKNGSIGKINKIEQMSTGGNYYVILNNKGEIDVLEQGIKAHSKNIIDLIEYGDILEIFVNGNEIDRVVAYGDILQAIKQGDLIAEDIKTILTHELYEQNSYKVVK